MRVIQYHASRPSLLTSFTLNWATPLQVEMVDFFPTVIELMGLPTIPTCEGVDQPPTVLCMLLGDRQKFALLDPTTVGLKPACV
jgi:hypothetical protein